MPMLHELQSDFRRFIAGQESPGLIGMVDGGGFDPASLLSIYRNNTLITLTEALSATFPVVRRLVDRRFFAYAAHAFVRDNFPSSPCLVEYGAEFPAFLAKFPPAAGIVYLPDVARLEWAINRVVHAMPRVAIGLASIAVAQTDPAQLRLCADPATRFIMSAYPVHRIWEANQPGVDPGEIRLEDGRAYLQIRYAGQLAIGHLSRANWTFRARIADGATLGAAVEATLEVDGVFNLAPALAALFEERLIVGFSD
jgi:hypothetical protein